MRPRIRNLVALAERGRSLAHSGERSSRRPTDARVLPMRNVATTGRTIVRLYGAIGASWWDEEAVSAADLARTLDGIGPNGIDLHINSPGGDVFDGIAMHAMLLDHPSDVAVKIDGIAASAASFIAMAGDTVSIHKPAKVMVHNAAGLAWGNKSVLRELADVLEEIDGTIAQMYADRSQTSVEDWAALMDAETWLSSARALELGLVDEVTNATAQEEPAEEDAPPAEEESAPVEDSRTAAIRAEVRLARAMTRG